MKRQIPVWFAGLCLLAGSVAAMWWRLHGTQRPRELDDLPLARTVDDPASKDADRIDWAGAADFRFTMGDGSGLQGYNVLQIGADGQCRYTFTEPLIEADAGKPATSSRGKRATFLLDADTLARFRKLLKDVDFFRLKKEYHADVSDGTQRWARVEVSGHRKAVYCNNFFPPEFLRISRFVNDRIVAPNSSAIDDAKTITIEREDMALEDFK